MDVFPNLLQGWAEMGSLSRRPQEQTGSLMCGWDSKALFGLLMGGVREVELSWTALCSGPS